MWRYLKSAFLVRPSVGWLGRFPINVLAVVCFGLLGIGHPAFWLLGFGLETAFLATLASNRRFQRLIDAEGAVSEQSDLQGRREQLILQLKADAQARMRRLSARCQKVVDLYKSTGGEEAILETNTQAMRRLSWVYLKLLIFQNHLESPESRADERTLRQDIAALEAECARPDLPDSLGDSKRATLELLQKRLQILEDRGQTLQEINSDLMRIEAQVDLALEQAVMRGRPQAISSNIELASQMLDTSVFGSSGATVADLEEALSA